MLMDKLPKDIIDKTFLYTTHPIVGLIFKKKEINGTKR